MISFHYSVYIKLCGRFGVRWVSACLQFWQIKAEQQIQAGVNVPPGSRLLKIQVGLGWYHPEDISWDSGCLTSHLTLAFSKSSLTFHNFFFMLEGTKLPLLCLFAALKMMDCPCCLWHFHIYNDGFAFYQTSNRLSEVFEFFFSLFYPVRGAKWLQLSFESAEWLKLSYCICHKVHVYDMTLFKKILIEQHHCCWLHKSNLPC